MKKIEPVLRMRIINGAIEYAPIRKNAMKMAEAVEHDLYNIDTLLAVAYAVHRKTIANFHLHIISGDECDMPERIDLKAIINQLTGE